MGGLRRGTAEYPLARDLDSANYNSGTVNINKSATILAVRGVVGSVVAFGGGPAITINTAGVTVSLRNIVIGNNVTNPGTVGIQMTNGKSLVLERCVIQNTPAQGILAGGAAMNIFVKDSEIREVGSVAIEANDGVTLDVVRTKMTDNVFGGLWAHPLTATGVTQIYATDSEVSASVGSGIGRAQRRQRLRHRGRRRDPLAGQQPHIGPDLRRRRIAHDARAAIAEAFAPGEGRPRAALAAPSLSRPSARPSSRPRAGRWSPCCSR